MKNSGLIGLLVFGFVVSLTSSAHAQRGFSRREQASLYAYTTQLQARQRTQFQQQFQAMGQQLASQQQALQIQQFQDAALVDYLNALNSGSGTPFSVPLQARSSSGNRAAQAFGTVHYFSPYYNRVQPYYDYGFIRSRNRQISPAAYSSSSF